MNTVMFNRLLKEVPPEVVAQALDDVLIDYAIISIKDEQSVSRDEAIQHITILKRLRDAIKSTCSDRN